MEMIHHLLYVSVNGAQQVLSLSQAEEVAFGFVELVCVVLQGYDTQHEHERESGRLGKKK